MTTFHRIMEFRRWEDFGDHLSSHSHFADEATGVQRSFVPWPKSCIKDIDELSKHQILWIQDHCCCQRQILTANSPSLHVSAQACEWWSVRLLCQPLGNNVVLLNWWANMGENFCWDLIWKVPIVACGASPHQDSMSWNWPLHACAWGRR